MGNLKRDCNICALLLTAPFIFFPLEAKEQKAIELTGQVTIEHEMGTLQAGRITATFAGEGEKKLGRLQLTEGAKVTLPSGLCLYCDRGEVDFIAKKGLFYGRKDCLAQLPAEGKRAELILTAPTLLLNWDEGNGGAIAAEGGVLLACAESLVCADKVSYSYTAETILFHKGAGGDARSCLFFPSSAGVVECDAAIVSLTERSITLLKPYGVAAMQQLMATAVANEACWREDKQELCFSGDVCIWYGYQAILSCPSVALKLLTNRVQPAIPTKNWKVGAAGVQQLKAQGPARLTYCTPTPWQLLAPGGLHLDCAAESLLACSGEVEVGQVLFHSAYGHMAADSLMIGYSLDMQTLLRLQSRGDVAVALISRQPEEGWLYAAKADVVEYDVARRGLSLSASRQRQVVIYDRENRLIATSPALSLTCEVGSAQLVRGEGDVRFRFVAGDSDFTCPWADSLATSRAKELFNNKLNDSGAFAPSKAGL